LVRHPVKDDQALIRAVGKINLLRVQELSNFGNPSDSINVDVIISLDSNIGKAFGFKLREDKDQTIRRGMLDILRDAYINDLTVHIDYHPHGNNGIIVTVELKDRN
jgi:hypothetical protein